MVSFINNSLHSPYNKDTFTHVFESFFAVFPRLYMEMLRRMLMMELVGYIMKRITYQLK